MKPQYLYLITLIAVANFASASAQETGAGAAINSAATTVAKAVEDVASAQDKAIAKVSETSTAGVAERQVIIVNKVEPTSEMVQQPTTVVEAQPLTVSRAEQIRKNREQAEVETEQRIVERLEQSRMEDEKRRADALFGGGFKAMDGQGTEVKTVEAAPAVVQAAPIVVAAPSVTPSDVRQAVREELGALKTEVKDQQDDGQNFISGSVGMMDYDLDNVETMGAFGISMGKIFPSRWSFEVNFSASNHYVDESYWIYREMTQYNLGMTTKFNILAGRVRPNIGMALNYVYRNYSEPRDIEDGFQYDTTEEIDSDAVDFGFVAGIDVVLDKTFAVGMDYRFMNNVNYRYRDSEELNSASYRRGSWAGNQLEDNGYDVWTLNLKYLF